MTAMKLIPIDWTELAGLPENELRKALARAYYTPRKNRPRRKHVVVSVVQIDRNGAEWTPHPLGVTEARVHATIARCDGCGQWTCAEKYQRVPHECVDRYAEPHPDINRKGVA